jgi:hypothetical protein
MKIVLDKKDSLEVYDVWTNTKYYLVRSDFGLRLRR